MTKWMKDKVAEVMASIAILIATAAFAWAWQTNAVIAQMRQTDTDCEKATLAIKTDVMKRLDTVDEKLDRVAAQTARIEGYLKARDRFVAGK